VEKYLLKQFHELVYGQPRRANQRAQSAHGKLFVLGNREIGPLTRLAQNKMTAHLPHNQPSCFCEGFGGFFAGDITELANG
jgi:hypothetical protein